MSDYTVLDDWNPSPETLRRWAYDEDLFLANQDEDLAIGRRDFLPILIPIADDPQCPKADYIISCLDFYLMFETLRGADSGRMASREAITIAKQASRKEVLEWAALLERRMKYVAGTGPVDRESALRMGGDLLNGVCRRSEISISSETETAFEVQLSVPPFHHHKEWLTIDKANGRLSFRR